MTGRSAYPGWQSLSPQDLLLLAVQREGSFTAAAQAMGMTQSAVSHAVRECERKVGAILFARGRTGARPTAAGQRAVVHARQIVRQLELLSAAAQAAAAGTVSGTLRIAALRRAAAQLLPTAIARLTARFPAITSEVLIVPELGRGTAGQVADGHADVAIAALSTEDEAASVLPGMVTSGLLREPFLLAHPAGHPDPRGLPLIDWAENCSSYTRAWWARQDWLPPATINVADDGVVLSMVAQGLGMAILPRLTLADLPAGVAVSNRRHPRHRFVAGGAGVRPGTARRCEPQQATAGSQYRRRITRSGEAALAGMPGDDQDRVDSPAAPPVPGMRVLALVLAPVLDRVRVLARTRWRGRGIGWAAGRVSWGGPFPRSLLPNPAGTFQ
jgi:DNA-binding transcriptional LysR family regulator